MKNQKVKIIIKSIILLSLFFNANIFILSAETKNIQEVKDIKNINIILEVLGKKYQITVPSSSTVYDAMNILQKDKTSKFNFSYKEYKHLGVFVDKINGVKGVKKKYWIYYVNGKKASVGISKYVLREGDIINWKQESF